LHHPAGRLASPDAGEEQPRERWDSEIGVKRSLVIGLETATLDGVQKNLTAIQDDVGQIADAQGDLSDERRQQVESAFDQLASAYEQTLAKVDCS
jgi:hypothetical protein